MAVVIVPIPDWARLRALLIALVLARGLVWLCVLPPFEGWDEYQHLGYVVHVATTGDRAVLNETRVPEPLLEAAVAYPQPESVVESQLGRVGAVGYQRFWDQHDPRRPGTRPPTFARGAGPVMLYQAQHAPFYYWLAAPIYLACGGLANLGTVLAVLRGINVLLTAAALAVALGVFRRSFRSETTAGLAGLVLACHPLFLLNGARVASDALGVFLATLAVALGVDLIGPGRSRRLPFRSAALGVLVGLASLAKASNLALLPIAGLACWLGARRGGLTWRAAAFNAVVLFGGFLAVTREELRFNLGRFGTPTAMQEAVLNRLEGRTTADLLASASRFDWFTTTRRLWVRDLFFSGGWSVLRPFPRAIKAYQFGATAGLVGWGLLSLSWLIGLRNQNWRRPGPCPFVDPWFPLGLAGLVLSYSAAMGYHAVQSAMAWGSVTTNPWYACPALPWFLGLVVAGGLAWPRVGPALPVWLAFSGLAVEFVAVWGSMTYVYSGGATGLEALQRLAWARPGWLGTPTLVLASMVIPALVSALLLTLRPPLGSVYDGENSCRDDPSARERSPKRWRRRPRSLPPSPPPTGSPGA